MVLKSDVEQFFSSYNKTVSFKTLMKKLGITHEEKEELIDILYELESEGLIMGNDNQEYIHVPKDFYLYFGTVKISAKNNYYIDLGNGKRIMILGKQTKDLNEGDNVFVEASQSDKHRLQLMGMVKRVVKKIDLSQFKFLYKGQIKRANNNKYYYVEINGKRFYIIGNDLKGAFLGDTVTVEAIEDGINCTAKVKQIVSRKNDKHIFELKNIFGELKWVPINGVYFDINYSFDDSIYQIGDRVLLELDKDNNATFISNVVNDGSLYSYIKNLAYDDGLEVEFSEKALTEAEQISGEISKEEFETRVDLRNLKTITIDPESAKDLDDAVSLEVFDNHFRLYVSVADVAHYVNVDSYIFAEAVKRGTSCYPSKFVIPMLPEKLSNDICSLNEGVDRLAKTCIIDIDLKGNILDYQVVNSIIRVDCKMDYNRVNNLLDGDSIELDYIPYYRLLTKMNELSSILQKRRMERGFICFESDEIEFDVDDDGKVLRIKPRGKGQSQIMIENFMLLANEMIAELAFNLNMPFIYRNHESPEVYKIINIKNKLGELKRYFNTLGNAQNPKLLQKIFLTLCNGKSTYEVAHLSKMILQNMERAYYSSTNVGHYGLALNYYATFTSPIRRLPDLLNHIVIDYLLSGKYEELDEFIDLYAKLAYESTEKQIAADEFETRINNILMQRYADEFMGVTLKGRIVFIDGSSIYIETKEGLYGYFTVNKSSIKKNAVKINGIQYKIGNTISVKINHVNLPSNEIVFTYVDELEKENNKKLEKRNENG